MRVLCLTDALGDDPSFRARALAFFPLFKRDGVHIEVSRVIPPDIATYDVVWLRRALLTSKSLVQIHSRPLVYDFDDATHLVAATIGWSLVPPTFRENVQAAHTVLAGSEHLADIASKQGAKRVTLLRTGVRVDDFHPQPPEDPPILVWSGSSSTLPYLKLIEEPLCKLVAAGCKVRVICNVSPKWSVPSEFVLWDPSSEKTALRGASVGLAPLPNTASAQGKCAYKIVQYMAAGLPVVASSVGANRTLLESLGCQGVLVDSPDQFEKAVENLLPVPTSMRIANRVLSYEFDVNRLYPILVRALQDAACSG